MTFLQTGEPEFQRPFAALRPFNQSFLRWHLHAFPLNQAIGHPNNHTGKTRRQRPLCSFPPRDLPPTLRRQIFGDLKETASWGKIFCIKAFSMDLPSSFHGSLRRMRVFCPSHQIPAHLNNVIQCPASQPVTEFVPIPISLISQYQTILQSPPSDFINQAQSQRHRHLAVATRKGDGAKQLNKTTAKVKSVGTGFILLLCRKRVRL